VRELDAGDPQLELDIVAFVTDGEESVALRLPPPSCLVQHAVISSEHLELTSRTPVTIERRPREIGGGLEIWHRPRTATGHGQVLGGVCGPGNISSDRLRQT
jgi:hypothetical protein